MHGIARWFFITAIIYGLLGMLLGLEMAMAHDHGEMVTHSHTMVIGWLSFSLFGFYYFQFGKIVSRTLSLLHFWMAQLSLIGLIIGLFLFYSGKTEYEPIAAVSSIAYALSFLVFAVTAIPALWARKE